MNTMVRRFLYIFALELILAALLTWSSLQDNFNGIWIFIVSFLGLLIVFPIVLIMNIRAIKATHSTYLYILLCVNILPPAAFIVYSFFRSIS